MSTNFSNLSNNILYAYEIDIIKKNKNTTAAELCAGSVKNEWLSHKYTQITAKEPEIIWGNEIANQQAK